MNITIEIVHKYIIKVHNIVLIILVCKWHLFFRILRTQKMVKILTFINQERQRVQHEYKMNFSGNVSSKWKISSKFFSLCHKSITMPRMNGLLYEVSNKGFCHKRCFRKSRGTTYFTCRAMNLRKVQFCWTCCLFRYVTDSIRHKTLCQKKGKKDLFNSWPINASHLTNWI